MDMTNGLRKRLVVSDDWFTGPLIMVGLVGSRLLFSFTLIFTGSRERGTRLRLRTRSVMKDREESPH